MKNNIYVILALMVLILMTSCGKENPKILRIGGKAPQFEAVDLDGSRISLSEHKGNPVILRFWSTDCKYCRADTPVFTKYYEKFKYNGLLIVYINTAQTEQEVREFIDELDVGFPVILDNEGELAKKYHVKLQPMTIVLSSEHLLLAAILGGVSENQLAELLEKSLEKS